MPTRPASIPAPSVAIWPFVLGDVVLLAIALVVLLASGPVPGLGAMIVATLCVVAGVGLFIAPFLMDYEARVRIAEASVRESLESQARKLAHSSEQLANAVSRSQSTEEQAGQALGRLEDLVERVSTQSEDLVQALAAGRENEHAQLATEIAGLKREKVELHAALVARVSNIEAALEKLATAGGQSSAAHARALDEVRVRVDEVAKVTQVLTRPASVTFAPAAEPEPRVAAPTPSPVQPAAKSADAPPAAEPPGTAAAVEEDGEDEDEKRIPEPEKREAAAGSIAGIRSEIRPRIKRPREVVKPVEPAGTRGGPENGAPELPLADMPPLRPPMKLSRRAQPGSTSLVATAYIGIGNKLYLRGEGPGLSWERGVPMQFLAIGKWGWTTTEADGPVSCRVFRNDETPMLDEDIVIAPGEKTEVTPRF